MPSFHEPDRDEISIMRGVLIEELEEWFAYGHKQNSAPPWFWFVFDDAEVYVYEIARLIAEPYDDNSALQAAGLGRNAGEQVENANDEQVACYSMARAAWVESP
jgi:hypothetical protein